MHSKSLVTLVVAVSLMAGLPAAATAGPGFACLPTCDVTDARFLGITGEGGLESLSLGSQEFAISVPAGSSSFQIGIFDGDTHGMDSAGDVHWDLVTATPATFTLIADPLNDGTGTSVVATFDGSTMPDNDWIDFTVATGPDAQSPGGGFFYRLLAELPPGASPNVFNAFKLRTSGVITVGRTEVRPYAFAAQLASFADVDIVYPNFPALVPTTYDGSFTFFFDVFAPDDFLAIWDGDLDRGKFDGTDLDTDDPNTPNSSLPPWSATSANFEGVAVGRAPSTGNPPDDREGGGLSDLFLKPPSIRYDLIFPDGRVFSNDNPSGNLEWERFSVTSGPFDPAEHDYATTGIPAGIYELRVEGLDISNLNHFVFPRAALCVRDNGDPCEPIQPFLLGDTVFLDGDRDGVQDFGEIGIGGVRLSLLSAGGGVAETATTDGEGLYSFEVEAGSYSVDVGPSNFNPGKPLNGLVATIANTLGTTIVADNDLTLDFGYRPAEPVGTGTPGYWKNHPGAWPVDGLVIGGVAYSKSAAIALMRQPTRGDMTRVMFSHVVAARLNLASGTDSGCASDTLFDADQWLADHPPGSRVKAKSPAWRDEGEALKDALDDYNNGLLCAPHRG